MFYIYNLYLIIVSIVISIIHIFATLHPNRMEILLESQCLLSMSLAPTVQISSHCLEWAVVSDSRAYTNTHIWVLVYK